ncbi:hypothetical protein IRJ41_009227, partial [Triplophysa rosa]
MRRYKKLKRKTSSMPSSQVCSAAKKLLSTLEAKEGGEPEEAAGEPSAQSSEEAAGEPSVEPRASTNQPELQDDLPYFPEHVIALNEVMNEYKSHQEGSDPSAKLKKASKIFCIKPFLGYMAEGKSSLANLFLNDTAKIRQWMAKLRSSKITETTIHHYLKNVAQFLDYVAETLPATSRLSKAVLVGIRQRLKTTPTSKDQWMFYRHLTAYLATIYGHCGGVFQNMLVEEVTGALKTDPAGNFLINIATHKTNQAFGAAQLSFTDEEYRWMAEFFNIRNKLVGGLDSKFFFCTSKPNPCKNLNAHFQEAWVEMGLPGSFPRSMGRDGVAGDAELYEHKDIDSDT